MVRLRALHGEELALLGSAERSRLADITHPLRARQFAAARLLLRQILGEALGRAPGTVPLRNTATGPALDGWHLSLSHSEEWVAAAYGRQALGVDIEAQRPSAEAIGRLCSSQERAQLSPEHYVAVWTRKEALAKALGRGVGPWLREWNVHSNTGGDWQWETRSVGRAVCSVAGPRGRAVEWRFYE